MLFTFIFFFCFLLKYIKKKKEKKNNDKRKSYVRHTKKKLLLYNLDRSPIITNAYNNKMEGEILWLIILHIIFSIFKILIIKIFV